MLKTTILFKKYITNKADSIENNDELIEMSVEPKIRKLLKF